MYFIHYYCNYLLSWVWSEKKCYHFIILPQNFHIRKVKDGLQFISINIIKKHLHCLLVGSVLKFVRDRATPPFWGHRRSRKGHRVWHLQGFWFLTIVRGSVSRHRELWSEINKWGELKKKLLFFWIVCNSHAVWDKNH